jgi:hypothetical protein
VFTPEQLTLLAEALDFYMTDEYGKDNRDGVFTPETWTALKETETVLFCLAQVGHNVQFLYEGQVITGRVREFRDGLVYAVSKGFMYRLEPGEIIQED